MALCYFFFRIMAELKHPHIVKYHESFFDPEEKFLCIVVVSKIIKLFYSSISIHRWRNRGWMGPIPPPTVWIVPSMVWYLHYDIYIVQVKSYHTLYIITTLLKFGVTQCSFWLFIIIFNIGLYISQISITCPLLSNMIFAAV